MMSSLGWYGYGMSLKFYLNGAEKVVTVKGYDETKGWDKSGTTEWFTVSNKTSGTTPFYVKLYDTTQNKTIATSSTYQLTVSPAMATISSAEDFSDEGNPSITFENKMGYQIQPYINFYYEGDESNAKYTIIKAKGTYTSPYKFTLTDAEREGIRNAFKDTDKVVVYEGANTYNAEGTNIGWDSKRAICTIVNANPTFTTSQISFVDSNNTITKITGDASVIVQDRSNLNVKVTAATGKKHATISKYNITLNGVTKTLTEAGSVNFGVINKTSTVSVEVVDSRGNTTTMTKSVEVSPYREPSVLSHPNYGMSCRRCEENGAISPSGTHLKVVFKAEWSAFSNHSNTPTITVRATSSSYTKTVTLSPTIVAGTSANEYRSYANISVKVDGIDLDMEQYYDVVLTCTDELGGTTPLTFRVPTAETTFHLREEGMGVGVGMYASEYKVFTIADDWTTKFKGEVIGTIMGMGEVELIPEGTDFDMLTEVGVKSVTTHSAAHTMINIPVTNAGVLYVFSATGRSGVATQQNAYVRQEYYPYVTDYGDGYSFYIRIGTRIDGVWTFLNWCKFTGTEII